MTPRLRTYAEQRCLDLCQLAALRRTFLIRLTGLLAAIGEVILNLMRG